MWGSTVLEVLIGLIVVYLTLSLVCSAASESLASALMWRGSMLRDAVARLMHEHTPSSFRDAEGNRKGLLSEVRRVAHRSNNEEASEARTQLIYSHPLVAALVKKGDHDPSYIPNGVFADVLIERLAPAAHFPSPSARVLRIAHKLRAESAVPIKGPAEGVDAEMEIEPRSELGATLRGLFDKAQSRTSDSGAVLLAEFRAEIVAWYERTMERTTGWYKRKTQGWLMLLAILVVVPTNADTIEIVGQLARNPAMRDTLGAAAKAVVEGNQQAAGGQQAETDEQRVARERALAKSLVATVDQAGLQLGWTDAAVAKLYKAPGAGSASPAAISRQFDWLQLLSKVCGLLISIFAVALGAPFWFQMLDKLVKLRAAGTNPSAQPATADAGKGGETPADAAVSAGASSAAAPGAAAPASEPEPTIDWTRTAQRARSAALPTQPEKLELAWSLLAARLAALVYEPEWRVKHVAEAMQLAECEFFDAGGTQAMVAVHPSGRLLVAFRGTQPSELRDILADADVLKVDGPFGAQDRVHRGFHAALEQVFAKVKACVERRPADAAVLVTGHSLGAALATLFAARCLKARADAKLDLITFGSPRVGDPAFRAAFDRLTGKGDAVRAIRALRFVNHRDLVTRVAPRTMDYDHVGDVRYFDERGNLANSETKWREFLTFVLDASAEFERAAKGTVQDHSMALYLRKLEDHCDAAT